MYVVFTLRYKLEGVAFYANKLPRKRTTHSDLQECGVISPVNLDYDFLSKFTIFESYSNWSNKRKRVLRLVHVSVGFPIRSSIFPLVPYSVLLCSVTCRSPNFFLSAPKRWSWSGFIKQFAIFTSVSILHTSTLFSVTSSQMWWNRTSMCFIFAW